MGNFRSPGSIGLQQAPSEFVGQGYCVAPPSARYSQKSPAGNLSLTPEQQQLGLDVAQLTLDIVGIFEPTPFADGANALISLGRGDWLGAGLSLVSIVPYVGDLAKVGKLPKYVASIRKAISLAKTDANFAKYLRPALTRLKALIDDIPTSAIPEEAAKYISSIKAQLDDFVKASSVADGPIAKALKTLDGNLKAGFTRAMELPPLKNPRPLKKHPGPVSRETLVKELESKGFVKVKEGNTVVGGTPKYGGNAQAAESEIWLRRVEGSKRGSKTGPQEFEAIRIDKVETNPNLRSPSNPNRPSDGSIRKVKGDGTTTPGQRQAADKPARRAHHSMTDFNKEAADHLNAGRAQKGDFAHWHHEKFDATADNLAGYLQGGKSTTAVRKFDPVGQPLN